MLQHPMSFCDYIMILLTQHITADHINNNAGFNVAQF